MSSVAHPDKASLPTDEVPNLGNVQGLGVFVFCVKLVSRMACDPFRGKQFLIDFGMPEFSRGFRCLINLPSIALRCGVHG